MKKLLLILGITLLCAVSKAQTPYYYYYDGEKQYLELNTEYAFLSVGERQLLCYLYAKKGIVKLVYKNGVLFDFWIAAPFVPHGSQ